MAVARAALGDLVQAHERAAADEEDVLGLDLDVLLLGVLAAAGGRDAGERALDDLEERLLDALAGDVARDGDVAGLARDLVDLVDEDDALLGLLDVHVGGLEEVEEDVLDVLADVAGLGERGGVRDGEGDVEEPGERAREERLAGAGGADEEDVGLLELDVLELGLGRGGLGAGAAEDALVVAVDGDGEDALGALLPDDVLVEDGLDLLGGGDDAGLGAGMGSLL